jgi:hypothetical protein
MRDCCNRSTFNLPCITECFIYSMLFTPVFCQSRPARLIATSVPYNWTCVWPRRPAPTLSVHELPSIYETFSSCPAVSQFLDFTINAYSFAGTRKGERHRGATWHQSVFRSIPSLPKSPSLFHICVSHFLFYSKN